MATTTTITSNFVGSDAGKIIGAAFKEGDTLKNGLVTLYPNVNAPLNMRKIAYTDGTTAYSCGFTPAGAVVLSERILTPVKLKNDISICKEDFRATWSEASMGASAANGTPEELEAIQAEVLMSTAERTDNVIWNGDSSNSDEWDGFVTLWAADSDVVKANNGITPTGNAITSATVEAELALAVAAIPTAMRRKKLVLVVGPDVIDHYSRWLISKGIANGLGGNANTGLVYGRYPLVECNGLANNTIAIYEKENLIFGTGLAADHNTIDFVDEDSIPLYTGLIRGKMVYNGGCQYYNSEDIVWYLTTTAAS